MFVRITNIFKERKDLQKMEVPVNLLTPLCVLLEVADAQGVSYDKEDCEKEGFSSRLVEILNELGAKTVEYPGNDSLRTVARFVNRYASWNSQTLLPAYDFLKNSLTCATVPQRSFVTGLQTPEQPSALNARVLYKICLFHRLPVNDKTTLSQLAAVVALLRDAENSLRCNTVGVSPRKTPTLTHEALTTVYGSLNNIKKLQRTIDPETDAGAVALAAINFGLNISTVKDPIREYKELKLCGRKFTPVDKDFRRWYEKNPSHFDLFLTFDPLFPVNFYSDATLRYMLHREGYSDADSREGTLYEMLQVVHLSETFYLGELPNLKSCLTKISLTDVEEVPRGCLLCYGSLAAGSVLEPITLEELTDIFLQYLNYRNPFSDDSIFSRFAVNKLRQIVADDSFRVGESVNEDVQKSKKALKVAIEKVESVMRMHDDDTRALINTYQQGDENVKSSIVFLLTQVLHIGMFCRGWKGVGTFAVNVIPRDDAFAMVAVTESMVKYEQECEKLGKLAAKVNGLPLVSYRDKQYYYASDKEDGITIGERLKILKEGEDSVSRTGGENMNSCIRLSSNWLCSSAYKYLVALGVPAPFEISRLRYAQ